MLAAVAAMVLAQGTAPVDPVAQRNSVLHGRVVILDDGKQRDVKDGAFTFWMRVDREWIGKDVRFDNGRFTIELLPNTAWGMPGALMLEGRQAWTWYGVDGEVPVGEVTIVAEWTKPATLRVVDAISGLDLDRVELVCAGFTKHGPPPDDMRGWRRIGREWTSPVELPLFEDGSDFANHGFVGNQILWARTPRHAWNRIAIDPTNGGERELRLWPATLTADVGARMPLDRFGLFATREDGIAHELRNHRSTDWRTYVVPLAAGRWHVELRPVASDGSPSGTAIASTEVELLEGRVTELPVADVNKFLDAATAATEAPPPVPLKRLTGSIRIQEEWVELFEEVQLTRIGPDRARSEATIRLPFARLTRSSEDRRIWSFDAGEVPCGTWACTAFPVAWTGTIELTSDTKAPARLDVPPPANVTVRIVDGRTREPLGSTLGFSSGTRTDSGPKRTLDPDEPGVFRFRAPVGPLHVNASSLERGNKRFVSRAHHVFTVETNAGANEFTFELFPTIDIYVEAFDGEARIPTFELYSRATPVTPTGGEWGDSAEQMSGYRQSQLKLTVDHPGAWRISMVTVPRGFRAPDPIVVEVDNRADGHAVFRLQRDSR